MKQYIYNIGNTAYDRFPDMIKDAIDSFGKESVDYTVPNVSGKEDIDSIAMNLFKEIQKSAFYRRTPLEDVCILNNTQDGISQALNEIAHSFGVSTLSMCSDDEGRFNGIRENNMEPLPFDKSMHNEVKDYSIFVNICPTKMNDVSSRGWSENQKRITNGIANEGVIDVFYNNISTVSSNELVFKAAQNIMNDAFKKIEELTAAKPSRTEIIVTFAGNDRSLENDVKRICDSKGIEFVIPCYKENVITKAPEFVNYHSVNSEKIKEFRREMSQNISEKQAENPSLDVVILNAAKMIKDALATEQVSVGDKGAR